eukprot:CAMPEP_0174307020 /NCGR_PEP_ID=MMETSP0810-20121108/847_1 /TAXON_ID=73025 ORGANISM="Eutreptiella gymnastica-like, Strain CCMP1594" /NCGR_SAMPLE_ID=MMETSP0810 /ASSEMBLY_ACC=CAM_ASM_000659 /LENGTH=166 /DNA_ID=CAMNT_0015413945 /DNA_START=418 /DNA_END=918 /DNA_ORIENTATION=+
MAVSGSWLWGQRALRALRSRKPQGSWRKPLHGAAPERAPRVGCRNPTSRSVAAKSRGGAGVTRRDTSAGRGRGGPLPRAPRGRPLATPSPLPGTSLQQALHTCGGGGQSRKLGHRARGFEPPPGGTWGPRKHVSLRETDMLLGTGRAEQSDSVGTTHGQWGTGLEN